MDVRVELKHITGGVREHPTACAIALAVRHSVGDADVSVDGIHIVVDGDEASVDGELGDWIEFWDGGYPVREITIRENIGRWGISVHGELTGCGKLPQKSA